MTRRKESSKAQMVFSVVVGLVMIGTCAKDNIIMIYKRPNHLDRIQSLSTRKPYVCSTLI